MNAQHFKFTLSKPEKGIINFTVTVEATDEGSANEKLYNYFAELMRYHSYTPQPIDKSAHPSQAGREMFRRLSRIHDPIAFILTLHLFVEHWINQILLKFCPNRDLTTRRYDFYKKLEIVRAMDKIPANLFVNISKLNDLRGHVAHNANYDLTTMDLNYLDCHPEFNLANFKPSFAPDAAQHHIRNVLGCVVAVTYLPLHDHCMNSLGFGPVQTEEKTETGGGQASTSAS